jgi:hypothetical protein
LAAPRRIDAAQVQGSAPSIPPWPEDPLGLVLGEPEPEAVCYACAGGTGLSYLLPGHAGASSASLAG